MYNCHLCRLFCQQTCWWSSPLLHWWWNILLNLFCFSARCPSSWRHSSPTWRNLPANINRKSERVHSSGSSFRKCVPPLELTHLPVRNILNRICWNTLNLCWILLFNLSFSVFSIAGKGFWSEMLGVGDFYYELGVQIIEVCLALKHRNGGL